MNLEEILGDVVQPCDCQDCLCIAGYIYKIRGTNYRLRMREIGKLKCWVGCPWGDKVIKPTSLEDILDDLTTEHQIKILFKINELR